MGEPKEKAPILQTTPAGSLCALPDRIPRSRRATVRLGVRSAELTAEARFQHQYGCLRDEVTKTLTEYLNCGILAHGAARVYCDGPW